MSNGCNIQSDVQGNGPIVESACGTHAPKIRVGTRLLGWKRRLVGTAITRHGSMLCERLRLASPGCWKDLRRTLEARFGAADVPVTLEADPRSDDPAGHASRYAVNLADLPQQLRSFSDFTATVNLEMDGDVFAGRIDLRNDDGRQ